MLICDVCSELYLNFKMKWKMEKILSILLPLVVFCLNVCDINWVQNLKKKNFSKI